MTYKTLITRALTAGLVAGALLAGYTFFVIEPTIEEAIDLEERLAGTAPVDDQQLHSHDDEGALFSRTEQVGGGLAAGVIYALVASAVFGTVLAAVRHRVPGRNDLARSVWLAAVGFATIALLPAIKYPASPPAVGDPDTVDERSVQYVALIAVSLVLAWAITRLSGLLRRRLDEATRVVAVTAVTVVAYGLVLVLLPGTPDAIGPEVPAGLVWDFRLRSLGGLALLWAGLGLGTGWLTDRDSRDRPAPDRKVVRA